MLMTHEQHRDIARRANWYFDCYFGALSEDSVVFNGDGVADLDRMISRLQDNALNNPIRKQTFLCDVGGQYSDWRPFDISDAQAIREEFIKFYGDVNRPDIYTQGAGSSLASPV